MAQSQNGYGAFTDYGNPGLVSNPTVPGTTVKILGGLRAGPVATVLLYVARRFNETVEPLVQEKGLWGFGPRTIRGSSTTLSNHASGTAIDLNSTEHSLGFQDTFEPWQVVAIVAILADCSGVVRWGGHYSGRKDEMHFEINADEAQVAALAARITAGSAPAPVPTTPTIPAVPIPSEEQFMATNDEVLAAIKETNTLLTALLGLEKDSLSNLRDVRTFTEGTRDAWVRVGSGRDPIKTREVGQ